MGNLKINVSICVHLTSFEIALLLASITSYRKSVHYVSDEEFAHTSKGLESCKDKLLVSLDCLKDHTGR